MDGYLLVDKPTGMSSFGVVARVRRVLTQAAGRKVKVGHTGTLDPLATGLMILVVGSWCRRASEFSKLDKTYEAELTLGKISSTADAEGEITPKSTHRPTEAEIKAALSKFMGQIEQVPPAFSAIKVGGQRAYRLARAGKEVKIEARAVTVYEIAAVGYDYPRLTFTAVVSSGTYIRSLATDIGEALGTGAYLSALRRVSVGELQVEDALSLDDLDTVKVMAHIKQGLPEGASSARIVVTNDN